MLFRGSLRGCLRSYTSKTTDIRLVYLVVLFPSKWCFVFNIISRVFLILKFLYFRVQSVLGVHSSPDAFPLRITQGTLSLGHPS